MTKEKISGPNATLALLIQLCGFQISTITYGIICSFFYWNILSNFLWLFLVGITINGFALTLLLIGVFSEKLTRKLINILMKILKLFRVKNAEIKREKMEEDIKKYNESAAFIKSHINEIIDETIAENVFLLFLFVIRSDVVTNIIDTNR